MASAYFRKGYVRSNDFFHSDSLHPGIQMCTWARQPDKMLGLASHLGESRSTRRHFISQKTESNASGVEITNYATSVSVFRWSLGKQARNGISYSVWKVLPLELKKKSVQS